MNVLKIIWYFITLKWQAAKLWLSPVLGFIKRNPWLVLFLIMTAVLFFKTLQLNNCSKSLAKAKADHAAVISDLELQQAKLLAQYQETARVKTQTWQRRVDDANQKAEQKAADLRVLTDDLSDAQRMLNKAIAARSFKRDADIASGSPVAATDTNGVLLSECAARYSELAVMADGHVIDVQRLLDAWPVDSEEAQ